ncbi:phenylacetate--CoA ligase family protein [Cognatitamlana onchidii]|uniref:CoF synthetase n=1 Tax=Cognatitamlana onchidii TaxID=2562860 RepID=UPI0010A5EF25|nr:CoF synthetase [Algibacter onchidii]
MSTLNKLRNYSFWFLDFLKGGGAIKEHYKEIESILLKPNSPDSLRKREQNLNALLKHATTTTKFYYDFSGYNSIQDFPIIKKTVIQDNFDTFKSKTYLSTKSYKVSTSGSTGVPFFLYQNINKRNRNTADVIYFSKSADYIIGNQLFELEVWRKHNKKGKLKSLLQNVSQFDVTRLSNFRVKQFLHLLKQSNQEKSILGFSSALESICLYLDKHKASVSNFNIKSIIANSEYLNSYTKNSLKKHFKAPVFSRYSSEEIGIIAQQTLDSPDHFKVNHASYYVELLKIDRDEPATPGEYGRLVVTDLFNYNMPVIRYDTGDVAKSLVTTDNVLVFESIEGRKMDLIYDTEGQLVSSFLVYTKFYPFYTLLKQYQFIQKGKKDYLIKLNIHDEFPFEPELIKSIKIDFGDDANVEIEYVDEIPPLASGKRKKVINLHQQAK